MIFSLRIIARGSPSELRPNMKLGKLLEIPVHDPLAALPLALLFLFAYEFNLDVTDIPLAIVDQDPSSQWSDPLQSARWESI